MSLKHPKSAKVISTGFLVWPILALALACWLFFQSDPADDLYRRANVLLRQGRYIEAISYLDQAISIHKRRQKYYEARGDAYQKTGQVTKAIADYTEALSHAPTSLLHPDSPNPDDSSVFRHRAECFMTVGNYQGAIADYSRFIDYEGYISRGRRESKQAYKSRLTAVLSAYNGSANAYEKLGNNPSAVLDKDAAKDILLLLQQQ